jgi:hypothetical protein
MYTRRTSQNRHVFLRKKSTYQHRRPAGLAMKEWRLQMSSSMPTEKAAERNHVQNRVEVPR